MRVAIIGRTEMLYKAALAIIEAAYEVPLIITAKETPEYKVTSEDFRMLAEKISATFIYTPSLEKEDVIEKIKSVGEIDLAISINFTGVISKRIMDLFKEGILNAHGGDLPRYRGNACQAWAIINGENEVGLCIHKMIADELDSGEIIEKKLYPININTRVGEIYDWFEKDIPGMMLASVQKIEKGNNSFEKQSDNPADALRCYPRLPEDGRINWSLPSEIILRLINASSEPYTGAFTFFQDKKIIIWRAVLFPTNENYLAIAGQVASIDRIKKQMIVITGSGMIAVTEISVDDWRGNPTDYFKSVRTRFVS